MLSSMKTNPNLLRLLEEAKNRPPMTREEIDAQRKSWARGELMLEHPKMTPEEAEALINAAHERIYGR